ILARSGRHSRAIRRARPLDGHLARARCPDRGARRRRPQRASGRGRGGSFRERARAPARELWAAPRGGGHARSRFGAATVAAVPLRFPAAGAARWRRFAEFLVGLGCSTLAAALCTAPLLAAAFHRVSLVSALANALGLLPGLAAIPIATALVVIDWTPLWWIAD